jgi:hypothetical protein
LIEEIDVLSSSDTNGDDPLVALLAIMEMIIRNYELELSPQQVKSLINELRRYFK